MANEKEEQNDKNKKTKPSSNANPFRTPEEEEYSNTANHKGAVDLGTDGTKATASQQQGQGSWNAKDNDNNRNGSESGGGGGGQGGNNKTGE